VARRGREGQIRLSSGGEEDVQALHRFGTKIRVSRGRTIFNQGDSAEYAYKVISGAVRLCRHLSDGRRQIAQFLFPGDFFNIVATSPNGFTAEAVSDAVLMSFPRRQLQKFREERASVQERFMTLLSQRVLDAQNHLMVSPPNRHGARRVVSGPSLGTDW